MFSGCFSSTCFLKLLAYIHLSAYLACTLKIEQHLLFTN